MSYPLRRSLLILVRCDTGTEPQRTLRLSQKYASTTAAHALTSFEMITGVIIASSMTRVYEKWAVKTAMALQAHAANITTPFSFISFVIVNTETIFAEAIAEKRKVDRAKDRSDRNEPFSMFL